MDPKCVTAVVDRALMTYTAMGLRGDQEQRQALRDTVIEYISARIERGEHDAERLVVSALKHLVALENRDPEREWPRVSWAAKPNTQPKPC
jgi:hypothetical protein